MFPGAVVADDCDGCDFSFAFRSTDAVVLGFVLLFAVLLDPTLLE